ncbi:MAG TPA: tetratricopeptide repeat protein [Anaeromyxobacteraceae bacterium]|nr:tetratricopeptide repeat protein [Anaeromyxobacteraceae bacterium]
MPKTASPLAKFAALAALGLAGCGGAADPRLPDRADATPVVAVASSSGTAARLQSGDLPGARSALEADLSANPDRLASLIDLAVSYGIDGHFDVARQLLDAAVAEGDARVQQAALVNLGELYAIEGYLGAATAHLDTARSIDPTRPGPHYALALLADGRGDFDAARDALREAVRLDPDGSVRDALVTIQPEERLHLAALLAWVAGDRARAEPLFRALAQGRFPSLAAAAERHLAEP